MDTVVLPKETPQPMTEAEEAGSPADRNLLRHLLDLETQAAALVDDAQAEADRRVAEGEKRSRARYDEAYAAEVAVLEAAYTTETAAIKADYKRQLDTYHEGLMAMPMDRGAFSVLAERFLLGEK
jgi:regulator of protease activity HflC (stomatin/prohibitin superfamily)